MVNDTTYGVLGIIVLEGIFYRLADGDTQAARGLRVCFQYFCSHIGICTGAGHTFSPPSLHHDTPIRLLVVAYLNHIDLTFKPEEHTTKG